MCKEVTRNILWSNSSSKEILTQFAEGLACKYYDAHQSYIVRLVDKNILTWMVMNKNAAEVTKPVTADSDRTVTIVNGIMKCDCGRTQQFLMPCTHICAVIKKRSIWILLFITFVGTKPLCIIGNVNLVKQWHQMY